jgi:CRISPR-associated protein Cmr6
MSERPRLKPKINNQNPIERDPGASTISTNKRVPLMFQAQIQNRGNIQFVGESASGEQPKYETWVKEWLLGCPPQPEPEDESIPLALRRKPVQSVVEPPQFGNGVKTWDYQIRWRLITNGGQDSDLIRPIFGSKGVPFFPGSSMKGAFRAVCPEDKKLRYCGGEVINEKGEKRTQPGILRFHGGYPIDMLWAKAHQLVDITHGQQPYQVMKSEKDKGENANVQISLYQPKFRFGISCSEITEDSNEWNEIQLIWEDALGNGIGSRVSAGYGYVKEVDLSYQRTVLSVYLDSIGISSQLLLKAAQNDRYKASEFRPNMFKAALRGHTLRILGGLVNEREAKNLTQRIWGGIPEIVGEGKVILGRVGIDFFVDKEVEKEEHVYNQLSKSGKNVPVKMPLYILRNGRLSLIRIREVSTELEDFLVSLIKFSVLFGGFGKSWRRVHHQEFYPDYFNEQKKPMIGCHWSLTDASQDFLVHSNSDLGGITEFITIIRDQAVRWIQSEFDEYIPGYAQEWREAWHPSKVQVWGRMTNKKKSMAIAWFHGPYQDEMTIYKSMLTGKMGTIGRIWHRMYPIEDGFIELLTIFPDQSQETRDFLEFLGSNRSCFKKCW